MLLQLMREDGVIDPGPQGFGKPVCEERDDGCAGSGQEEGRPQGEDTEEQKQGDRKDPEYAGNGVIKGDGPETPAVFMFKRELAFRAM